MLSEVPPSHDWLEKARQDVRAARRLLADPPEAESAAYHVHQAAEKAIKALLALSETSFPRRGGAGHDLVRLARLVPVADPLRDVALRLSDMTPWATAFRYPAEDSLTSQTAPTPDELRRRLADANALVEAIARRLAQPRA